MAAVRSRRKIHTMAAASVIPTPPNTPRMELNASVLSSGVCTSAITPAGSNRAVRLMERVPSAEMATMVHVANSRNLEVFMLFVCICGTNVPGYSAPLT